VQPQPPSLLAPLEASVVVASGRGVPSFVAASPVEPSLSCRGLEAAAWRRLRAGE
jgi:hypothetical protein